METNSTRGMGFTPSTNKVNTDSKNYLLAIALTRYAHLPHASGAEKETKEVVQLLAEKYQFNQSNTQELYNEEATKVNIVNAFKDLVNKVKQQDNLIIFFSGHGEYDDTFKEGYWMPYHAQVDDHAMAIPNSLIKTMLGAIKCHHLFVMVDSCLTGALFNRGAGKVVQRLEKDPSRWGLTSGRNQIGLNGQSADNNEFTRSIIKVLKNNVGPLGVAELCRQVVESLPIEEGETPIGEPLNVSGHRGGQFVFKAMRNELLDWNTATATGTITAYQHFLVAHPDGKYVATANSQIATLKAAGQWAEITASPENTVVEIGEKLSKINNYITSFGQGDAYNEALALGENLEYKRDFLAAKGSIFKLRIFAQRNTPFKAEAQELVRNFGKEEVTNVLPTVLPDEPVLSDPINLPAAPAEQVTEVLQTTITPQKQDSPLPAKPNSTATVAPSFGMSKPTQAAEASTNNNKWLYISAGLTLLVIAALAASKFFFTAEMLPIALDANPASGTVVIPLQEGDPPYDVVIFRNKIVEKEFSQPTKGDLDVSEYFQEEGNYEFKVEDAEKRVFTEKVIVKKDEDYPPFLVPKVTDGTLTLIIRKGKPPYQLQLGEGPLVFNETYDENGTKTIDLSPFRDKGGAFELSVVDGNNKKTRRIITVEPAPKVGIATMLFKHKIHSFGTINEEEIAEHIFSFTNNGTETLWIEKVKPSSSSLSVSVDEEEILPGEIGLVTVLFNPKGRLGSQNKTVRLETNGEPATVTLTVTAEVIKAFIPEPEPVEKVVAAASPKVRHFGEMSFEKEVIDFGSLFEGQKVRRKYKIRNTGKAVLEIEQVVCENEAMEVNIDKMKLAPGSSTTVTLLLTASQAGKLKEELVVTANSKPEQIRISIVGAVASVPSSGYPFMVDLRDGQKYKTEKLKDGRIWMVENLKYKTSQSFAYFNKESNVQNYGRLYKWSDAVKACPEGWHLPTYKEWEIMRKKYGGFRKKGRLAYEQLIEGGKSGFSAQLGGHRYTSGSFQEKGVSGTYWSSEKSRETKLVDYFVFDSKSKTVTSSEVDEKFQYASCRCVKD